MDIFLSGVNTLKLYTSRYSKKDMLLAALWYSHSKPLMNSFLRPVIEDLNKLYYKGMLSEHERVQLSNE